MGCIILNRKIRYLFDPRGLAVPKYYACMNLYFLQDNFISVSHKCPLLWLCIDFYKVHFNIIQTAMLRLLPFDKPHYFSF
jgi:hypothetical protein